MVQVKLRSKQKISGRLGEVTNEGFVVQTAAGDKIENQKISFNDVKSIKVTEGGGKGARVASYIIVGVVVGFVAFVVILYEVMAHGD